jgi:hypothetical protein
MSNLCISNLRMLNLPVLNFGTLNMDRSMLQLLMLRVFRCPLGKTFVRLRPHQRPFSRHLSELNLGGFARKVAPL